MQLPKELTTITPLSKILAVIVFLTLPLIGFFLGIQYAQIQIQTEVAEINALNASLNNSYVPVKNCTSDKDCPKPSLTVSKTISIDKTYNNKQLSLKVGDTLKVVLPDEGSDGGYRPNEPIYDRQFLKKNTYQFISPPRNGLVGSPGTNIWTFEAIKKGEMSLIFESVRPFAPSDKIEVLKVNLKIG